ncbi:MAG: hypothetical protein H6550_12420 [Chitinophagales bacterium]|nr:hypothetical protein [Chitinophagales bacterium]
MRTYKYIIVLLILSCVGRISLTLHYMDLLPDKVRHILAAKNMNEGHGFATSYQSIENVTETVYTPITAWPPGYSILVGAMQKITGGYLSAAIAIDVLSVILFYLGLYVLLDRYKEQLNKSIAAFILIFFGVSLAPFGQLSSTDLLSISFFMFAVGLFMKWIDNGMKTNWVVLLFVLSAFIPAFARYGYYPIVFIFPIFLFALFLLKRDKAYLFRSVTLFVLFGGLIALYAYYQYRLSGVTPATTLPERHRVDDGVSIYWENIKEFNEFVYNGILSDFFITNRLSGTLALIYKSIKLLITFAFCFLIIHVCYREYISKRLRNVNLFILVTYLVNVSFLVLLSLKNPMDRSMTGDVLYVWTYVIELRYFAPSYILALIFVLYNYGNWSRFEGLFVNAIIMPLVIVSCLYSLYTVASGNKTGAYKHTHKDFLAIREELKGHDPANTLVLVNGWNRTLNNNAYSSLIELEGYDVLPINDVGFADASAKWYWNNMKRFKQYDKVYYVGDAEKLEAVIVDSNLHLEPTGVAELYYMHTSAR